jgi:hypothetical protein
VDRDTWGCACCSPKRTLFCFSETEGRKEPFVQVVHVRIHGVREEPVGSGKRVEESMAAEKNAEVLMGWLLCGRLLFRKGNA